MKSMKAVCIYSYGGPEKLVYEDCPCPHPGSGEVLVRVHAAGINPVDWKIREGHMEAMVHHTLPLILGWDVSGVVESLGPNVTRLKIGDEVYSHPDVARDGSYAEFIVMKESEVAMKPKSIDHIHAAALPLAGLTAWQSLFDTAGLLPGQRVLIHAAAGGVGSMAVQMAKCKGAQVIGTASQRNHDYLRELGVDQVVDYERERFEDVVEPVDVILDTLGGETQARSWAVLRRGGILVSIASPPPAAKAVEFGVRQAFVFTKPSALQLGEMGRLVEAEKLKAIVETILPLSDATRGQELSERGHTRGKIVLRVV
jgi:NADPH:quinone reductase-like Zn-dependent oxidoreductase